MATKKVEARLKRKVRIRKKIAGTAARPRLSVFRSLNHMYAQVIDDDRGVTLAAASTAEKGFSVDGDKTAAAKVVGKTLAERCLEKGIKSVTFDRNGFIYHGRIKAVAEAAREAGLEL